MSIGSLSSNSALSNTGTAQNRHDKITAETDARRQAAGLPVEGQAKATQTSTGALVGEQPDYGSQFHVGGEKKSRADQASIGLKTDFDSFIKMLITQLKHQDPTDPMDAAEFTKQIVQFTGVEQQIASNKHLENLLKMHRGVEFNHAAVAIGKEAAVDTARGELEGVGGVEFSYKIDLPDGKEIGKSLITITSEEGIIAKQMEGPTDDGAHSFAWDGNDNNNLKRSNGVYKMNIQLWDKEGRALDSSRSVITTHRGVVSETRIRNGSTYLKIGDREYPFSQVMSLGMASNTASTVSAVPAAVQEAVQKQMSELNSNIRNENIAQTDEQQVDQMAEGLGTIINDGDKNE
jgi:flagellar basal-body rod modification protein FlgD